MSGAPHREFEQRLLLLVPTERDADLTGVVLNKAGIAYHLCTSLMETCAELESGAAALLIGEEALLDGSNNCLRRWLTSQEAWSDLPLIVVARPGADSSAVAQAMDLYGNVTVLERPTRIASLVSAVRTALRARLRQYQSRDEMESRERELQSKAFLGAIVASSDDAIITKSLDGNIMTWNAGAERIFGYTAEETVGKSILLLIPPERHSEEADLLQRLARGERIEHFETLRVTKDGRLLDISLTVSPVRNAGGEIMGASTIARDITQRKRTEAALRDADRRKDEFLATLAHELRNPLAPIRNSLHILRMTAGTDPAAERVCAMMERQVNHLVRLVDDLMEVSRITRGLIELRREETDLAAIIRSAVETSKPLIDAYQHQLAISLPAEPIPLDGDTVRLAQVFANLLNNAAKYTEPGGQLWISATRKRNEVIVAVRDNGIGISPEKLPSIFDMFMQVDRSTDRAQGGLGIGLTIVRNLVELHGGSISAHSAGPSCGSEFIVRLPVAKVPSGSGNLPDERRQALLPPRRVLVVDDNHDSATSMAMLLKCLGMQTEIALDGATALDVLGRFKPEVVLLDLGMSGMDGFEVARRIRAWPECGHIVLIALTGWGQPEDRIRTAEAGFDHHLVKPADLKALQSLLAQSTK